MESSEKLRSESVKSEVTTIAEISVEAIKFSEQEEKRNSDNQNKIAEQSEDQLVQHTGSNDITKTEINQSPATCSKYCNANEKPSSVIESIPEPAMTSPSLQKPNISSSRNITTQCDLPEPICLNQKSVFKRRIITNSSVINKLAHQKLKNKPKLNKINGLKRSPKNQKPGRSNNTETNCNGKSSSAVITAPSLPKIVLANDPFTFVPGQLCTPQVAFAAKVVTPAEKVLSPGQKVDAESSESLTVDPDSEPSAGEELLEEVDNPVIFEPESKEKLAKTGSQTSVKTDPASNSCLDDSTKKARSAKSPRKRHRKGIRWSHLKRRAFAKRGKKKDTDVLSTSLNVDSQFKDEKLTSGLEIDTSSSVLQTFPNRSKKKQLVQVPKSEDIAETSMSTSESSSFSCKMSPEKSSKLNETVTMITSSSDLPHLQNPPSANDVGENQPTTNSVLKQAEVSEINTVSDTDALKPNENKQRVKENSNRKKPAKKRKSAEEKFLRHQKQIIALQKARAARWEKLRRIDAEQKLQKQTHGAESPVLPIKKRQLRKSKTRAEAAISVASHSKITDQKCRTFADTQHNAKRKRQNIKRYPKRSKEILKFNKEFEKSLLDERDEDSLENKDKDQNVLLTSFNGSSASLQINVAQRKMLLQKSKKRSRLNEDDEWLSDLDEECETGSKKQKTCGFDAKTGFYRKMYRGIQRPNCKRIITTGLDRGGPTTSEYSAALINAGSEQSKLKSFKHGRIFSDNVLDTDSNCGQSETSKDKSPSVSPSVSQTSRKDDSFSADSEFVCPSGSENWFNRISTSGSPPKSGLASSIGGVISQLFDDITTKPGNGFVVNIRLDVERKNCPAQNDSNLTASTPVNSRSDKPSTQSKNDVTSCLSNFELCSLLEERVTALSDLQHNVRSNLLDNIRHVKYVLQNGS